MVDPSDWSCNDVSEWLKDHGFQKYCHLLCEEHKIDGQGLLTLTENDLKQPPIEIRVIGDVKRLIHYIKQVKTKAPERKNGTIFHSNGIVPVRSETVLKIVEHSTSGTDLSDIECTSCLHKPQQNQITRHLDPEKWKTCIGILYFFIGMFSTCYSIVVVQENAPDQRKHPPLPDIFLNHFPQISWAYKVSDAVLISLMITWLIIVSLHKHRWILARRTFCLMGTMYLLRCACILITQLPVPETNVQCYRPNYTTFIERVQRALEIFFGGGMKVTGLKTCGDYMFSGHTVTMTLLNFFITEYTPKKFCWLHLASWIANLFGMFFILAGHGHYSIDVFVAFVFTSRLFLYYHTLANNINLMSRDIKKTKIWFPVFSFFESNSTGVIPYEFEWPFPTLAKVKNSLRGYELISTKGKS